MMRPLHPEPLAGGGLAVLEPKLVQVLDTECFCVSLDGDLLRRALESGIDQPDLFELIRERCPYLFAARPVFLPHAHLERMAEVVAAVEEVVALPAWREEALAQAPAIARHDPGGARSVFFGYDFHVTEGGIGLIEINTNAGGAMLNAILARAQRACCPEVEPWMTTPGGSGALEEAIVAMFRNEWALSGRDTPLSVIAIVDETPEDQYLYPEFLLFQRLFRSHGIHAVIADPSHLRFADGRLWHAGTAIDLVYNRLTDFALDSPASSAVRAAYLNRAVVLTPHPQAHALFADKRNLVRLSDPEWLRALGVRPRLCALLGESVPRTERVTRDNAERLWQERRKWFFKPTAGFGSRAAYRGDKLTQRVWGEIAGGGYVAQRIVAPGERLIEDEDPPRPLKFDVRVYAYEGKVQWVAARLYQGQTTNFRTPGGGFAPVYEARIEAVI